MLALLEYAKASNLLQWLRMVSSQQMLVKRSIWLYIIIFNLTLAGKLEYPFYSDLTIWTL